MCLPALNSRINPKKDKYSSVQICLNQDLKSIQEWNARSFLQYNAAATQVCTLSQKKCCEKIATDLWNNKGKSLQSGEIYYFTEFLTEFLKELNN